VEDASPRDKPQAADGVSEDAEGLNKAAHAVSHGLDVKRPVKLGCEEDTQVTNGAGDRNSLGRVRPRGEEDGGRGFAKKTGAKVGGLEEHELRLVEVDCKAGEGEPCPDTVPCGGDFRDGGEEGGARGVDIAVVNVEGEVDVLPVIGRAEEWGGGKSG